MDLSVTQEVKDTLKFLDERYEKIQFNTGYEEIVFVLGHTGSGKTTFTQWVAGDNSKLTTKKSESSFLIEDDTNKISSDVSQPKTEFPELVIDRDTNTAYYDCPGFDNVRNITLDVTSTYFIKKVIDNTRRVKIIFTIDHSSMKAGNYRSDFTMLLNYAADLINSVTKFKDSVAIVVTKVTNENDFDDSGDFVKDSVRINEIVEFLQEAKITLPLNDNRRKFIEGLLKKDTDGKFFRIGLFRIPNSEKSLSKIPLLQDGKQKVKALIQNLKFTPKNSSEFGYHLSDNSVLYIREQVKKINQNMKYYLDSIAIKVKTIYSDLVEEVLRKTDSFFNSTTLIDVTQLEAQTFSSKFNHINITIVNLVKEISNLTNPEELVEKVEKSITSLNIEKSPNELSSLKIQTKYLNFLKTVSTRQLFIRLPVEFLNNIPSDFIQLQEKIERKVQDAVSRIHSLVDDIKKIIQNNYDEKIRLLEIQKLPAGLKKFHDKFQIIEKFNNIRELLAAEPKIYEDINNLKLKLDFSSIQIIVNRKKYFNFLKNITMKQLPIEIWSSPLTEAIEYFGNSQKWYEFLNNFYLKFSEYSIQTNKKNLRYLNLRNVTEFLNKIVEFKIADINYIKNIQPTKLQLDELNHVLNLTLYSKPKIDCSKPAISITGNFISIQDITNNIIDENYDDLIVDNYCKILFNEKFFKSKEQFTPFEEIEFINIFASNTIFIDENIELNSRFKLSIIAPKWVITSYWSIDLSGDSGRLYSKAALGTDGQPGQPGEPGGYFFGIGDQFVDGHIFSISVNGGHGGQGQDGGDGQQGMIGDDLTPTNKYFCEVCNDREINGFYCESGKIRTEKYRDTNQQLFLKTFKIHGKPGKDGGNAGSGGIGGRGGNPGHIELIELSRSSQIVKNLETGKNGTDGKGGKGGSGGQWGNYTSFQCVINDDILVGEDSSKILWNVVKVANTDKPPASIEGFDGDDGSNILGMENPKEAATLDNLDRIKIFYLYKTSLEENFNDRFEKFILFEFLHKFEDNENVKKFYNMIGLRKNIRFTENKGNVDKKFAHKRLKRIANQEHSQVKADHENSKTSEPSNWFSWIPTFSFFTGAEATITKENYVSHSSRNLLMSFNGIRNEVSATAALDINGNLALAKLIINKMFGCKKIIQNRSYVSLDIEWNNKIIELSSEILPVINSSTNGTNVSLISDCNNTPHWYQNIFLEKVKKINGRK